MSLCLPPTPISTEHGMWEQITFWELFGSSDFRCPISKSYLSPCSRFCLWDLVTPTGCRTLVEHPQLILLVKMKKEIKKMGDGEVAPLGKTPASRHPSLASAPEGGQASREGVGRCCRPRAKTVLSTAPEWLGTGIAAGIRVGVLPQPLGFNWSGALKWP